MLACVYFQVRGRKLATFVNISCNHTCQGRIQKRRSAMFIENRPNVTFDQIMFQNVSKEIYFHIHIQIIIFGSAQFLISMFNWRGCEARLRKVGVKYDVTITSTNNIGIWKDGTWKKNYIKIQTMYLNASLKCLPTT